MRPLPSTLGLAALALGCSSAPLTGSASPAEMTFPHEAVHIDGVCSEASTPASRALAVTVEAPYANGQRRFRIVNASGSTHEVRAKFVVANEGRCDRGWVRSTRHEVEDARTCERPQATTLAPDQSMEMRVLPYRQRYEGACTLVGLALHAEVDGQPACVELGSWVAYRPVVVTPTHPDTPKPPGAGSDD
jgi:hypothetical protein